MTTKKAIPRDGIYMHRQISPLARMHNGQQPAKNADQWIYVFTLGFEVPYWTPGFTVHCFTPYF